MATTLTTRSSTRHAVPTRAHRVGQGRLRPPTRRRPVAAPHVVAAPDCESRRSSMPVALLVAVAVTVAALVYAFGAYAGAMADSTVPSTTTVVRVAPGETLSDLAVRTAPGADVAAVVDRIRELNGLVGAEVFPGQPLTVPTTRG